MRVGGAGTVAGAVATIRPVETGAGVDPPCRGGHQRRRTVLLPKQREETADMRRGEGIAADDEPFVAGLGGGDIATGRDEDMGVSETAMTPSTDAGKPPSGRLGSKAATTDDPRSSARSTRIRSNRSPGPLMLMLMTSAFWSIAK